jgi:hypothetical protein
MSVAVRGYTSIADSQSTALKGYNCNPLRSVHGMLRQAPQPAFHRAQLPAGRLLQNRVKPLAQKRILVFRMPNRSYRSPVQPRLERGVSRSSAAGCGGREGAG